MAKKKGRDSVEISKGDRRFKITGRVATIIFVIGILIVLLYYVYRIT